MIHHLKRAAGQRWGCTVFGVLCALALLLHDFVTNHDDFMRLVRYPHWGWALRCYVASLIGFCLFLIGGLRCAAGKYHDEAGQ